MKRQKQMVLIAGILLVLCLNLTFVLPLQAGPKSEKKPQQELMLDSQDDMQRKESSESKDNKQEESNQRSENNLQLKDRAKLLSNKEKAKIKKRLKELEQLTDWDLMALTVKDAEGMNSNACAETWFDKYCAKDDGVICAIDMDNREIVVRAFGEARFYITDKRSEQILDAGYEKISEKQYADTLLAMFAEVENAYEQEDPTGNYLYDEDTGEVTVAPGENEGQEESLPKSDDPPPRTESYHVQDEKRLTVSEILIALGIAAAAAGGTVFVIRGKYRLKIGGYQYSVEKNGRINLHGQEEQLVDTVVTTRMISKPDTYGRKSSPTTSSYSNRNRSSYGNRNRSSSKPPAEKPSSTSRPIAPRKSSGRSTVHRGSGGRSSSGGSRKF